MKHKTTFYRNQISRRNCNETSALFPLGANPRATKETPPCLRKQPSTIGSQQSTIRIRRVTTAKQLSTTRADSTKKQPIMHTPPGHTRFTPGITPTKLPRLIWKNTARSS